MPVTVTVNDKMQRNYRYVRAARAGRDFDEGFRPQLTPKEMLELGVFGGRYLRDCTDEFPASWFAKAKLLPEGAPGHDARLNHYGVDASTSLAYWRKKGWIHPDDPRGWFQWYCRYYMGRRHEDDARQIRRWRAFARHAAQLRQACGGEGAGCRPRQRQALLHWAYDSRRI